MTRTKAHVIVIDPALRIAETECFNRMALTAPVPLTYHLPAMYGTSSLGSEDPGAVLGVVVLGSSASVNDRSAWQAPLEEWLRERIERHRWPTFGFCYGHQMLAYMYGGKVGFVEADQAKRQKLSGLRQIELLPTPIWQAAKVPLVVSHQETVTEAPACMKIVATSPMIPTDGLAHRTLPIWSLQSHPEATPEFLAHHSVPHSSLDELRFGHSVVASFFDYCARAAKAP